MSTRSTARIAGTLFVIATAAGVLSVGLLGDLDSRASVAARSGTITVAASMVLLMAAAIAMIPAVLFPVLKAHNEALALGYVVSRTIEVVVLLPAAIGPLLLLALSEESDATLFQMMRPLVVGYADWGYPVSALFFSLSALFLNYLLYRAKLVPRLISAWGLVAVVPYLADGIAVMFGLVPVSSVPHTILSLPLALNEMALAVWLLARGFSATGARSAMGISPQ